VNRQAVALVGVLVASLLSGDAGANGREVQRDVVGRVVEVDAQRGVLVVERTVQGKTFRISLRTPPAAPVFRCVDGPMAVDDVRAGDHVGVWYERAGREGLANLLVVETRP
jgi:hypothetical protein